MNKSHSIAALALGASALLLVSCGAPPHDPGASPPLAGARIGGPFALTNQIGQRVSERDFAGRYTLVYFGYSFCPDVCPVDLGWLMRGLQAFERQDPARGGRIQPIFITVDPARDTPEAMANYVRQFHPRLIGLTGSEAEIAAVATKYLVTFRRQAGVSPGSYAVAHTQLAYLMGPMGEPIALIPIDKVDTPDVNEGAPELVAAELARWVR
ncbi:MAG: SCO family protein [Sphingopyxis sp.]